jgi:predicted nucleic acid-binding protein
LGTSTRQNRKNGRWTPTIDGLIAATGVVFKMIVVTRNIADMQARGVALFNPWNKKNLG